MTYEKINILECLSCRLDVYLEYKNVGQTSSRLQDKTKNLQKKYVIKMKAKFVHAQTCHCRQK